MNLITIFVMSLTACTSPKKHVSTPISGEGSSFSLPLTSKLFKNYSHVSKQIVNYKDDSSYKGINALINGTVDFAVSIVPLTDEELAKEPNIIHIPISVAGVNFAYHITNKGFSIYDDPLYLTPDLVSKILLGRISNWNDPQIVAINKKVAEDKSRVFPHLKITVVHRADKAGDTYLLSKFLTKADSYWSNNIGIHAKIKWPVGLAQKSTLDVMRTIMMTEGAFGYSTMIFGMQNNIPLVRVKNFTGTFGRGCNFRSLEAMKLADPTPDNRVDLTYPKKGKEAAVATGFIYILVKQEQNYNNRTQAQAQATVDFINWLLSPMAQSQLDPIYFAPLTPRFRNAARTTLNKMTYNGKPLTPNIIEQ